ncbi:MAG: hypothetical protein R3E48_08110 [Burkholderiaceae bacterium]
MKAPITASHRRRPRSTKWPPCSSRGLAAGALGFSTSRTTKHRAKDGRFTPSLSAAEPEPFGLAAAMRRAGAGVLQVNSDFGAGEFEILREAARVAGRPLSALLLQSHIEPRAGDAPSSRSARRGLTGSRSGQSARARSAS